MEIPAEMKVDRPVLAVYLLIQEEQNRNAWQGVRASYR